MLYFCLISFKTEVVTAQLPLICTYNQQGMEVRSKFNVGLTNINIKCIKTFSSHDILKIFYTDI